MGDTDQFRASDAKARRWRRQRWAGACVVSGVLVANGAHLAVTNGIVPALLFVAIMPWGLGVFGFTAVLCSRAFSIRSLPFGALFARPASLDERGLRANPVLAEAIGDLPAPGWLARRARGTRQNLLVGITLGALAATLILLAADAPVAAWTSLAATGAGILASLTDLPSVPLVALAEVGIFAPLAAASAVAIRRLARPAP